MECDEKEYQEYKDWMQNLFMAAVATQSCARSMYKMCKRGLAPDEQQVYVNVAKQLRLIADWLDKGSDEPIKLHRDVMEFSGTPEHMIHPAF